MKLTHTQLEGICNIAKTTAIAAGEYIQSQFDKNYQKQHKTGGDSLASQVVTEVDLKAQEIILEHLMNTIHNYDLGLLTEEATDDLSRAEKKYFWCIDPMDGTLPFTEHRTGYAVSIALIARSGDPVIGVVYIPDLQMCYTSIKGMGVRLNDEPFLRKPASEEIIQFYMDKSFQSEPYFDFVKSQFNDYVANHPTTTKIEYHAVFGGVRNAIGVMSSGRGCYFKFQKTSTGCGSIWDYAATRLFLEELGLCVANAHGERLHLNNLNSTFMNEQGILYATDHELKELIIGIGKKVFHNR